MTPADEARHVFVVPHLTSELARSVTQAAIRQLQEADMRVRMLATDAARLDVASVEEVPAGADAGAAGCEIAVIFGGDGTILRAAELARGCGVPLLGVNLGHVGFLAERESDEVEDVVGAIVARDYTVEERMTVQVTLIGPDGQVREGWALNEASIEKAGEDRMLDLVVAIDDRPLSRWSCDGLLCSTPTGSTAYAWSAGGPVVWPDVAALVVVPNNAHALFHRAAVVSPEALVGVQLVATSPPASLWLDGRRKKDVEPGSHIEIRRSAEPVRLARLHPGPFTDRLVAKFQLPVAGWRHRSVRDADGGTR